MDITWNCHYIVINNETINGNNNTVRGHNNTIVGHSNRVYGNECSVVGNKNMIYGDKASVVGDDNEVCGRDPVLAGERNIVYESESHRRNTRIMASICLFEHSMSTGNYITQDTTFLREPLPNPPREQRFNPPRDQWFNPPRMAEQSIERIPATSADIVKGPIGVDSEATADAEECVICADRAINCIVTPCNHLCLCVQCSRTLCYGESGRERKAIGEVTCPMCKNTVREINFVYHAKK